MGRRPVERASRLERRQLGLESSRLERRQLGLEPSRLGCAGLESTRLEPFGVGLAALALER